MKEMRRVIQTEDGSTSLFDERTGDNYHSFHGAETESSYVFIYRGLEYLREIKSDISILEIGLGTGLNLCLTLDQYKDLSFDKINYVALEPLPIVDDLVPELKFNVLNKEGMKEVFRKIHTSSWGEAQLLREDFTFFKYKLALQDYLSKEKFDLIYYDAFGPSYQPEMWGDEIIAKVASFLNEGGVLVTYCAQGQFRRNLESNGLKVERLPGPPGKREMIRACR